MIKIVFSIVALLVLVACASKPTANIKLLSIEKKSANFARISLESDSEIDHLGNVMVICPLESGVEIKNTREYSYFINGHLNDYKPTSPPWKYVAHAYIDRNENKMQAISGETARKKKHVELINMMPEIKCKVVMIKMVGSSDYSNTFTLPKDQVLKAFSLTK